MERKTNKDWRLSNLENSDGMLPVSLLHDKFLIGKLISIVRYMGIQGAKESKVS